MAPSPRIPPSPPSVSSLTLSASVARHRVAGAILTNILESGARVLVILGRNGDPVRHRRIRAEWAMNSVGFWTLFCPGS